MPDASDGSGVDVLIGGQTAIFDDFSTVLSDKLPLFIGVVVLISFLLLMAVFRSLLIPVIAAAMNLLAAAASFGVITAVFQWGWAASLLGIDKTGPIEAFVPGDDVRDRLRPLDGLPGVPRQPDLRGVAPRPATTSSP